MGAQGRKTFSTVISEPKRFIVQYKVGDKVSRWSCSEFNASRARARCHRQPFSRVPGFRILAVLETGRVN